MPEPSQLDEEFADYALSWILSFLTVAATFFGLVVSFIEVYGQPEFFVRKQRRKIEACLHRLSHKWVSPELGMRIRRTLGSTLERQPSELNSSALSKLQPSPSRRLQAMSVKATLLPAGRHPSDSRLSRRTDANANKKAFQVDSV